MNEENQAGIGLANASKMSRRGFLKTAALAGAAVTAGEALTACSAGPSATYDTNEEVFVGVCRGNCFGGCPMDVHVRDGRLVRTSAHKMPEDQWTRICSKGLTSVYRTYSKERIKYPMKRAGERGGDQWERISWDEAIKEITDKIKQVQAEDGPESFAMFFGGSGNYACASGTNMPCYAERFMYATYSTPIVNDMDKGMVPIYPHLMMNGVYAPNTVWSEDWDKTSTFIFWGANPLQSIIQVSGLVMNAKEKGVKLICVDPQFSVTASKCDMHVPVRPGSDTLLAMAMMRIILENGWEDVDYLKNYTTAAWLMHDDEMTFVHCSELGMQVEDDPYVVFDAATSTFVPVNTAQDPLHISDGTLEANGVKMRTSFDIILEDLNKYSLAEYAEMTNLPEETIFEFADIYANNGPATILTLMGFNHYGNSAYAFTAVNMLPAICGYYNKPYAGMASYGNSGYVDMAVSWPSTRPGGPVAMNAFHPMDGSIIPFSKFYELLSKK